MLKAYKYRMYPNKEQVKKIWQHIGTCRFLYNLSLEEKIRAYQSENKSLTVFDLNNRIPELKKLYEWMGETNSQSLQAVNQNVETSFKNFFRKKADFPRFKSKKNPVQSFQIPQHYEVKLEENRVKLQKTRNGKNGNFTEVYRNVKNGNCIGDKYRQILHIRVGR